MSKTPHLSQTHALIQVRIQTIEATFLKSDRSDSIRTNDSQKNWKIRQLDL